jgi:metal-responsive CopG/Arc/MetJ family transcriptional regulator
MASTTKISVLLSNEDAERFEEYCQQEGYKKSTLVAKLIREHLDKQAFHVQIDFLKREERNRDKKK